jgi:malonyl-CoA O-methyltransferase
MVRDEAHRRAVRAAFDRAAPGYDAAAGVQREVCAHLLALADAHPPGAPALRVLDAGCGTGFALTLLGRRHPAALRIALDFAPSMLERVPVAERRALRVCADLEDLPFPPGAIDVLWSSLSLQWCDADRALREFARVLAPGGKAWIATLGPRTLFELREAFLAVDDDEHVLRFLEPHVWLDAAREAGFRVEESRRECMPVLAPDLRGIVRHLKGIGAHRIDAAPRRALTRGQWRTLQAAYEGHRRADGLLPASYDVVLLALRKA